MLKLASLVLAAGLAVAAPIHGAFAQQPGETKPATATPPPATAPAATPADATAAQPAAPKGIPVPSDLPVVKKTELEDGLILEDLKIGDGYEVKDGGAVVAHYHGTLKEGGKVFDSSFERGEPASFPLSGVIPGWQKGVPGMKIGGIRRLTIPAKLGYGERGAGADIPPNSDLVFIIQLVDALQIVDEKVGDGEEVGSRPVCVTSYVMTGADGKEIETASKDHPFIWVPGEHMGMSMGLEGMKVGGKRKLSIPSQMNQTASGAPGNRPANVPITVEVELLAVKNLVPPQPKK
jgi:FKBP-type peptidyl-prolyl cis-trans isomerase